MNALEGIQIDFTIYIFTAKVLQLIDSYVYIKIAAG